MQYLHDLAARVPGLQPQFENQWRIPPAQEPISETQLQTRTGEGLGDESAPPEFDQALEALVSALVARDEANKRYQENVRNENHERMKQGYRLQNPPGEGASNEGNEEGEGY